MNEWNSTLDDDYDDVGLPVVAFLGQQVGIEPYTNVHCWGLWIRKIEDDYEIKVKESNPQSSGGLVPEIAIKIGKFFGVKWIDLLEPSSNENASEEECFPITFWFVSSVLDSGNLKPFEIIDRYHVKRRKYAKVMMKKKKTKAAKINCISARVLRQRN